MSVTAPSLSSALDLQTSHPSLSPTHTYLSPTHTYLSPTHNKPPPIPDYEELRVCKLDPHSSALKAVPNEYVPSPPEMEQFRGRLYTVGVCQPTPTEVPLRRPTEGITWRDSATTYTTSEEDARSTRSNSSSLHKSHHLSVVSMESGLSFGYDVEINPSLPLEVQPWFHGKLSREDAVALLNDEGDFLVRENTSLSNTYTLSMHWRGQSDHTLIQCDEVVNSRNGITVKYSFDGGAFDSIPELIYHHLKYQIPINRDTQNMLMTPISRPGAKIPFTPAGYYQPTHDRSDRRSTSTGPSSPTPLRSEDHTPHRSLLKRTSSPDVVRQYLRPLRSSSMSPGACNVSPRHSPARDFAMRGSNSSGNLLETEEVDRPALQRTAMSPPPMIGAPRMRSRAMTDSRITRRGGKKRDSFGDYEVMESVSLLGSPPSHRKGATTSHANAPVSASTANWTGEDVKYAEIQHSRKTTDFKRRSSVSGTQYSSSHHQHHHNTPSVSGSGSVKYAEVRFQRRHQSQTNVAPHPFSTYDTVQSTSQAQVSPYQSRAEILAQKLQPEPTPTTSSSSQPTQQRLNRVDSSPHPFARHSTHSLPRQASSPLTMAGISEESAATPLSSQQDAKMHSLPDRVRRRTHVPLETSRSSLVTEDQSASKAGQGAAAKVPKNLPGYEVLVTLHDMLSQSSEMELANHLTRADAVAFLLTPRPGEDKEVWKDR